jgi:hypothetical protein
MSGQDTWWKMSGQDTWWKSHPALANGAIAFSSKVASAGS